MGCRDTINPPFPARSRNRGPLLVPHTSNATGPRHLAGTRSFAELLRSTLHRGIIESYRSAGLAGHPSQPVVSADHPAGAPDDNRAAGAHSARAGTASRSAALIAAAVATITLIAGSYTDHWTWTGLTQNGPGHTLWNWLTLIVLPITITTATVWPKTGRAFRPAYRVVAAALGVAWIATLIGGYVGDWAWTGYPGNTLWEWVQLLLAPIAITTCVVPELIRLVAGEVADLAPN